MVEPRGRIGLPADGKIYRVCLDYGRIGTGKFVPSAAADPVASPRVYICRGSVSPHLAWILDASRGFHPVVLIKVRGNTTWLMSGPQKIIADPPADLAVRARIQVLDGLKWVDVPKAETHHVIQFPKK